jgi:hypothetical protein
MQGNEKLQQFILSKLPSSVELIYVDRDDSLTKDQLGNVNEILNLRFDYHEFKDAIYEDIQSFLFDSEFSSINEVKKDLVSDVENYLSENGYEIDADDAFENNDELIRDTLIERDISDPVADLIKVTSDQTLRIEMHTNFEGLDGGYNLARQISYQDYFKTIVDTLYLNPAKVKSILIQNGFNCTGVWPNLKYRNGKEYVSCESFVSEVVNTTSNCNRLTFIGKLDLSDLENYQGKITIPAGNDCGLFDSFNGAGGTIEMELLRPFTIDMKKAQYGKTEYDRFVASLDDTKSYSMDSVYGPTSRFWGSKVSIK